MKKKNLFKITSLLLLMMVLLISNTTVFAEKKAEKKNDYPYPITDFSLDTKDNQVSIKLKTDKKVNLLLEYNKINGHKSQAEQIRQKNEDNFKIDFEIGDEPYLLDLTLDHQEFFFSTSMILEKDDNGKKIRNIISNTSDYVFEKKESSSSIGAMNETPDDATRLSDGETNEGYISPDESDVDWYKFYLSEDGYIDLQLYSIPSGVDYDLYLYDSSDTTDEIWAGMNSDNNRELLQERLLDYGTYYVKVKSFNGYDEDNSYIVQWELVKQWPTESTRISRGYSESNDHLGVDVGAVTAGDDGDNIYSIWDGTVTRAEWSSSYGYVVYITSSVDGDLIQSRYAHMLEDLDVTVNEKVQAGDKIGDMGNTGESDGVHLHFETRDCGSSCSNDNSEDPFDPMVYFPEYKQYLKSVSSAANFEEVHMYDKEEVVYTMDEIKKMTPEQRAILSIPVPKMTPEQKKLIGLPVQD
ncbi:peptidoglycan DD-metalloendopeptidase family protein [Brevibacillus migulae]|uniref:peptidoglycan DD-metalloendopeptidase family protein n=1 Tax=Brevibacillus migulae TaxID=1644114 RepID=UPI00106E9191|nr:peptidoglycan DD-metalloendopeptidase family protein [Brevibacillus migulae]